LEIAEKIKKSTVVVTDNDGDLTALEKKYANFIGSNKKSFINICYDKTIDSGALDSFNYNTLEPKLLKANNLQTMNTLLNQQF